MLFWLLFFLLNVACKLQSIKHNNTLVSPCDCVQQWLFYWLIRLKLNKITTKKRDIHHYSFVFEKCSESVVTVWKLWLLMMCYTRSQQLDENGKALSHTSASVVYLTQVVIAKMYSLQLENDTWLFKNWCASFDFSPCNLEGTKTVKMPKIRTQSFENFYSRTLSLCPDICPWW